MTSIRPASHASLREARSVSACTSETIPRLSAITSNPMKLNAAIPTIAASMAYPRSRFPFIGPVRALPSRTAILGCNQGRHRVNLLAQFVRDGFHVLRIAHNTWREQHKKLRAVILVIRVTEYETEA